ncbi:MAG: hypothetical protein WD512_17935 [Candidatus Paceibacterota bacterium]
MRHLKPLHEVDDWGRPLYKCQDGVYYCDTNLGQTEVPDIHWKQSKYGEPESRINEDKWIIGGEGRVNDTY